MAAITNGSSSARTSPLAPLASASATEQSPGAAIDSGRANPNDNDDDARASRRGCCRRPAAVTRFVVFLHVLSESVAHSARITSQRVSAATSTAVTHTRGAPFALGHYFTHSARFYRKNLGALRQELLSGFTIAVLQIPESVAFSFVAGLDPIIGLRATVFIAFVCGMLGARPGMVSGAAGAMAVILADLSGPGGDWVDRSKDEVENLVFMTIILTGAIQLGIGLFGLARFSKLIPFTAMIGFMNGLAIIILISQLDAFKECPDEPYETCARADTLQWMTVDQGRLWMVALEAAMSAAIIVYFPYFKKLKRYVPAALVALIVVTAFEHGVNRTLIHLPTRTVEETAPVDGTFVAPRIPPLPADTPWNSIITYAVILALVGVIESVMTAEAVAELLQEPANSFASTQESLSQGTGNFLSGLLGSMGGDAMIGQSTVNVLNGARGRLSSASSGIFLLIIILALSPAIGLVPVACLTGILFIIVVKTFHWPTFLLLFQLSWPDSLAIVMVTVLAVMTNLAIAVGAGVVWRALVHSYASISLLKMETELVDAGGNIVSAEAAAAAAAAQEREQEQARNQERERATQAQSARTVSATDVDVNVGGTHDAMPLTEQGGAPTTPGAGSPPLVAEKRYFVEGPLFFGSAMTFRSSFVPATDPARIIIDFSDALVADFSGVTAIRGVCKRYQQLDKTVVVRGLSHPSRTQIRRNLKLRHFVDAEAAADSAAAGLRRQRADALRSGDIEPESDAAAANDATAPPAAGVRTEARSMLLSPTATSHTVSTSDRGDENEPEVENEDDPDRAGDVAGVSDLGHLRLFRAQGDAVPYEELTADHVIAELRRGGIDVIEGPGGQATLRRRRPQRNEAGEGGARHPHTDTAVDQYGEYSVV